MINPEQIPDEVVEAAAREFCLAQGYDWGRHPDFHPAWRKEARAAIAAGLAAWPEAFEEYMNVDEGRAVPCIVLPKEASDD